MVVTLLGLPNSKVLLSVHLVDSPIPSDQSIMLDPHAMSAFSSREQSTTENPEIQQRLGLYQVFLRLYEQNRGLLDEILSLENSGSKALARVTLPYIQGLVLRQQVYLVTNVLGGDTQALTQSQNLWIIGRDSRRVNLPIQDKRLSRRHAAIRYANKQFYLVDLGSSNGTYINGEPIRRCTSLKDGDRIRLGSVSFSFFICDFMHSPPQLSPEVPNARDMPQLSQTPAQPIGVEEEEVTTNIQPPTPKAQDGPNPIEETFMFLRKQS